MAALRGRHAIAYVEFEPEVLDVPADRYGQRFDVAIAYPPPTMVDGRPT